MRTITDYILFLAIVLGALYALEKATGQQLFDDASVRIIHR